MKKKRMKIKWMNVIKAIVLVSLISIILHDIYMVTIYSTITGNLYGFTWYGLITFILFCVISVNLYEDLNEQTKSVSNTGTVRHTNK